MLAGIHLGVFFLLGSSCEPLPNPEVRTFPIEDSEVVGVRIGSGVGLGGFQVVVGSINGHGAIVPGPDLNGTAEGTGIGAVEFSVETDSLGVGSVAFSSGQPEVVTLQSGEASGAGWILQRDPIDFGLLPGHASETPSDRCLAWGVDGLALAVGGRVLWQPDVSGAPPVLVAELDADVIGLDLGDIDMDGRSDLAVWTEDEVILLRGRGDSGHAWAGGFSVEGGSVADVVMGDVDFDGTTDLAIAYSASGGGGMQVLRGDGVWGFDAVDPLVFGSEPLSVTFGQFSGNGQGEIAVLFPGTIVRYGHDPKSDDLPWSLTGRDLGVSLSSGGYLGPTGDVNGDGVDDLFVFGPPTEDGSRELLFYTLTGIPTVYNMGFNAFYHHLADISGDGVLDLVLVERNDAGEPVLRSVTADTEDNTFRNRALATLPAFGPIAVDDRNGDGVADVTLANLGLRTYPGSWSEVGDWQVMEHDMNSFAIDSMGGVFVHNLNADLWADAAVVRSVDGEAWFKHYRFTGVAGTADVELRLKSGGEISLDTYDDTSAAEYVDLVYCYVPDADSHYAYVLMQDGTRVLWEVTSRPGSHGATGMASQTEMDADHVACGDLADGGIISTATRAGRVTTWKQDGFRVPLVEVASSDLGVEIGDLGIWDPDGAGGVTVTCEGDCSLAVGDLDRDGLDELVVQDAAGITLTGWGESVLLGEGPGLLSLADIDGDDLLDVVATDPGSGSIRAWRTVGLGVAPAISWHTRQSVGSAAMIGDVNGDGIDELIFQGQNGSLLYSKPSGN